MKDRADVFETFGLVLESTFSRALCRFGVQRKGTSVKTNLRNITLGNWR